MRVSRQSQGSKHQRVLLLSVFHPELVRGGAQQICYELFEELKEQPGVVPILLASVDNSFPALFKSGACITGFDEQEDEFLFLTQEYDNWWNKTSSPRMINAFIEFLHIVKPDVVHFHHFFTFGIDLLTLTRRELPNARIVFTFHEFLSICAADGHMVRKTDGSQCSRASSVRCHQCFPHRSPDQFLIRQMWMLRHFSVVDAFSCPSRFMLDFFKDWGIPSERIFHVTNSQRRYGEKQSSPPGLKKRFGFFGKIYDPKGIHIILRAVQQLRSLGFTDFTVEINGDMPYFTSQSLREEFEGFLANEKTLPKQEQIVTYNGGYHIDDLAQLMARVDWCIVPSIWRESFGLVISEAWMFGKPVICSNSGGPQERVRHDVDGLQFHLGDPRALAEAIRRAATEDGFAERLHKNIPEPSSRSQMALEFLKLYNGEEISA